MKKEKKPETPNAPAERQPLDDLQARFGISSYLRQAENEIDKLHQEIILTRQLAAGLQAQLAAKDQEIATLKAAVDKLQRVAPAVEAARE